MPVYYVSARQTEYRTFRVEADNEDAAYNLIDEADWRVRDDLEIHTEFGEQTITDVEEVS